jgi:dienelactone hydrolase
MARTGYGHMLLDDLVDRLRDMRQERRERLAAVRTRRQAEAYQRRVRRAVRAACGPRPPKTPLNLRLTGTVERPHYTVEKVLYDSRPGCTVSAHIYVPKGLTERAPAVLGTCGHSATGKLEPLYQAFCQRLARAGFVVLILDPFNQGERDQYHGVPDADAVASCTHAHNMMGKQLDLVGDWFGMWRAWDGIRGLDVLLARPDVDRTRVGLTGNSGGGTMTTWLWAMEPRFTMAAPSCFVTTFANNLKNELPADCEQYPPGCLGNGLEMADFLLARAPDPVLLLGQRYCFFDRRGLAEAYDEVRAFYDVLRAPADAAQHFLGPEPHGFSVHNQEAMVEFFARHAGVTARRTGSIHDLGSDGLVTPGGNTVAAGATPIFALTAARADELAAQRRRLSPAALRSAAREVLHLPDVPQEPPHYRILRGGTQHGRHVARYAVETERDVRAILHKVMTEPRHMHTLDVESRVTLYVPHVASDDDLGQRPATDLAAEAQPLYLVDPRGLGETRADETGDFFAPYGLDYMLHGHEMMFGRSYLGGRVFDVLRTMDLLAGEGARRIDLTGRGLGSVIAALAALLHRRATSGTDGSVALHNAPVSWHGMTQVPLVAWPASTMPRGVLARFDLPDVYRALGRRLRLVDPWDEAMQPLRRSRLTAAVKAAGLRPTLVG